MIASKPEYICAPACSADVCHNTMPYNHYSEQTALEKATHALHLPSSSWAEKLISTIIIVLINIIGIVIIILISSITIIIIAAIVVG